MSKPVILVVDDEPQILRVMRASLPIRGYEVITASSGEDALDELSKHVPDLVILDLVMPDTSGLEVCRRVREFSSVPIIVLSAKGSESDKVTALDLGADDYVTKPFGMDELLARVRAALRRATPAVEEPVVRTDAFTVDLAARRVTRDGTDVRLTPTEWHVLEMLVRHAGRLVPHRQ